MNFRVCKLRPYLRRDYGLIGWGWQKQALTLVTLAETPVQPANADPRGQKSAYSFPPAPTGRVGSGVYRCPRGKSCPLLWHWCRVITLRRFLKCETADLGTVLAGSKRSGELDGSLLCCY